MPESRGRSVPRTARRTIATSLIAAAALLTASCTTGGTSSKADIGADDTTPVTITFWHGLSSPHEVDSINSVLAKFHEKYPYITVKAVAAQTDDKVNQAIRGGTAPDVASSFDSKNVGGWCSSGAFQDLNPNIKADHVDMSQIPKAVQSYTAFGGKRCTMPWLADTFGLYYNKKLFAEAGITDPPKTMTELAADAKKLTKFNADGSIKTAGFMPYLGGYEMLTQYLVTSWGGKWLTSDGQSDVGGDPAFAQALTWQKKLVDWFGVKKLVTFKAGMGDEFSAQNAFETGKLAMMVDGEWRNSFIKNDKSTVDYGTALIPPAEGKSQLSGAGFVGGNVIGMPRGAKHPGAAWKLIKYLTTDTEAVTTLADAIGNVPTTIAALNSPSLKLSKDPHYAPFLEVFKNPLTTTTPASGDGGAYLTNFGHFVEKWQSGDVPDLKAALAAVDKQNNAALKLGQ